MKDRKGRAQIRLLPCFVILLAISLTSCAVPLQKKILKTQAATSFRSVPCLRDWQDRSDGTLRFFLVHGMNNHPFGFDTAKGQPNFVLEGVSSYRELFRGKVGGFRGLDSWADLDTETIQSRFVHAAAKEQFSDFIETYAQKGKLTSSGKLSLTPIFDRKTKREFQGYVLKRSFRTEDGYPVEFYVLCWSPFAAVKKEEIYGSWDGETISGDFSDHEAFIDDYRSQINRNLKHGIISWGFTDASMYVSKLGGQLEEIVAQGVNFLGSELKSSDRVAVVTASLGSTITLNTIKELTKESYPTINGERWKWEGDAAKQLNELMAVSDEGSRACFYMFANQYALLSPRLEDGGYVCETLGEIEEEPLALGTAVEQARERLGVRSYEQIPLVAFTDPDDLLSFPMNSPSPSVSVMNVYVRNNGIRFVLPIFGGITNPGTAHSGYGKNSAVLDLMLKGHGAGVL